MLTELQQRFDEAHAWQAPDVGPFLITDRTLARCMDERGMLGDRDETLFIVEDEDGLAMSLFLDEAMLERLEVEAPLDQLQATSLDDFWKVIEGVSHFRCMAFKADCDREVSLLELELQGEIDKYVISLLTALAQGAPEVTRELHSRLFDNVSFHRDLDPGERERYRAANDYAARYCAALSSDLLQAPEGALDELRGFYRLPIDGKVSHIHSRQL